MSFGLLALGLALLLLTAFLLGWWWGKRGPSRYTFRLHLRPNGDDLQVHVHHLPPDRVRVNVQKEEKGWLLSLDVRFPLPHPSRHRPWEILRTPFAQAQKRLQSWLSSKPRAFWLLGLALGFYLLLRFTGLYQFPLTFHADEANQTLLAETFVQQGFRGDRGELFPTFFRNVYFYNLGVSVYLQILPYLLFGKHIWVTRGVSILVSLLVPWAVAAYLRNGWGWRHTWFGVLVVSGLPTWFLHSRTAFEVVEATAFFAVMVYAYLRYLQGEEKGLYLASGFAALAFYTYAGYRMVVVVFALLALVLDFHHHRKHGRALLRTLGWVLLLAFPLARFLYLYPNAFSEHLQQVGSYVVDPTLTLWDKVQLYARHYLVGWNPYTWFHPNPSVVVRHQMPGYGHLFWGWFPFWLLGLGQTLRRWRQPEARPLLWAWLAMPSGAALYEFGITRTLVMVVPSAVWIALGFDLFRRALARRWDWFRRRGWRLLGALLVLWNLGLWADALFGLPRRIEDYGLYGAQYGSPQLFWLMRDWLYTYDLEGIYFSSTWLHGADLLVRYYYNQEEQARIRPSGPLDIAQGKLEDGPRFWFVLSQGDEPLFETRVRPKLAEYHERFRVLYPNGETGFRAFWFRYIPNLEEVLEEERRQLLEPQTTLLWIQGVRTEVTYPPLDIGTIENIVDRRPHTLIRTALANPLVLRFRFEAPLQVRRIQIVKKKTEVAIEATLQAVDGRTYRLSTEPNPLEESVTLNLPTAVWAKEVELRIREMNKPENQAHVHLWEVEFLP